MVLVSISGYKSTGSFDNENRPKIATAKKHNEVIIGFLTTVSRLPGVSVTNGNEIHIRNNPEQPVIVIDDVVYEDDNDILTMIQTSDMSSLSLLRGADAAILHVLYGGNTLLAHEVGAGKTFEMAASAMEAKRLGPVSYTHLDVYKRQSISRDQKRRPVQSTISGKIG